MMTDKAVAEADLITLVPVRGLRISPSAESCWWRTLRSTRSVVAPLGAGGSGSPKTVALTGRQNNTLAGFRSFSDSLKTKVNTFSGFEIQVEGLLTSSCEPIIIFEERPQIAL